MNRQELSRAMEERFGPFITVNQIAECIGCHRHTVRQYIRGLAYIGTRTHWYRTTDVAGAIVKGAKYDN